MALSGEFKLGFYPLIPLGCGPPPPQFETGTVHWFGCGRVFFFGKKKIQDIKYGAVGSVLLSFAALISKSLWA
jgi:hypothetical protein